MSNIPRIGYPSLDEMRVEFERPTMEMMSKPAENNWPLEVCIAARIVHLKCIQNDADHGWNWYSGAKFFNKFANQHVPDGLNMKRILLQNEAANQAYCATQCPVRHDLIVEWEKDEWIAANPYGRKVESTWRVTRDPQYYPRHSQAEEYKEFAKTLKLHLADTGNLPRVMEPRPDQTFGPPNSFDKAVGSSKRAEENRQSRLPRMNG